MSNTVTASGGTPAGSLTVRGASEQISLSPERPFVVGRALACDLVVDDGRVSRRHLTLEPSPQGWTAIDISANGTWHAGERVHRLRIRGECHLRLGAADGPQITVSPVEPQNRRPSGRASVSARPPSSAERRPAVTSSAPQPRQGAGGTDSHWARNTYIARDDSAAGPMLPDGQSADGTADEPALQHDSSTNTLIRRFRARREATA